MVHHINILRPEFCVRYLYASENALQRHFYISFAAHVEGTVRHKLSFWDWLMGRPSMEKVNEHVQASYYKQRIHWYYMNGMPVSIEEEIALNSIKSHFDKQSGRLGGFKVSDNKKGKMAYWPAKRIDAKLLYS